MKDVDLNRLAVLVALYQKPGHGYALIGDLNGMGLTTPTATGGLYRRLAAMASEGLVSSEWDTPDFGPARRVYSLTPAGREAMVRERKLLHDHAEMCRALLAAIPRR